MPRGGGGPTVHWQRNLRGGQAPLARLLPDGRYRFDGPYHGGSIAKHTMRIKQAEQIDKLLDGVRKGAILIPMTDSSRRAEGKRGRSKFVGRPNDLGGVLADLRTAKGLSLRQVEEASDGAVSNAYLSQLENGKIQKPSPNVLHTLAEVYAVPYETLMEKAGYLLPPAGCASGRRRRLAAFAIDDLTAEEEEELLKYLAFLRSRNSPS